MGKEQQTENKRLRPFRLSSETERKITDLRDVLPAGSDTAVIEIAIDRLHAGEVTPEMRIALVKAPILDQLRRLEGLKKPSADEKRLVNTLKNCLRELENF